MFWPGWFGAVLTVWLACAADRLTALSVGVSGSRIPLKGMLGRTSWCNYFMSLPISVEIEGRMRVTPENVCTMLAAGGVFLLYMGTSQPPSSAPEA